MRNYDNLKIDDMIFINDDLGLITSKLERCIFVVNRLLKSITFFD